MSQQVEAILEQIERLDEADRVILEQRLQELAEAQWRREAENARPVARKRGIDQPAIDDEIKELRDASLTQVRSSSIKCRSRSSIKCLV